MGFYIYKKDSVLYKKVKLKFKYILYFFIIQLIVSFAFILLLSKFYDTPKENKLKQDVEFLITEFDDINRRFIESEALLQSIMEKDSIIYKSIFDVDQQDKKSLSSFYDVEDVNDYKKIVEETQDRLSVIEKNLAKESYSISSLIKVANTHEDLMTKIPAIQPIDNKDLKRTASGWGMRIHPIYNIKKFHYGLDFTAPTGTSIYSTGNGTIQHVIPNTSRESKGYGNVVVIDHGYGYKTLYAHMDKFKVKEGEKVIRGQTIGYVGNTGISTGPHLHYEVIKNGQKVNPIHYLFNSLTPEEYHKIIEISNSIKKSYD